ncbi:MAG TPA: ABC transporter substrate-binding protein [Rhodocyclaceae bacterium]|nr:ABC transporter substrate-binding protein [Rhodocyclaceae bacterium]
MKKTISFIAATLLGLGAALTSFAQENPKVIRIAFSGAGVGGKPASGSSFLATAHQKGFLEQEFAKDGIKVEWSFFVGAGPATNEALALKKIDFATQGDLPLTVARSNGLRTRILLKGGQFSRSYIVVPTNSSIQSVADLKGKKFAVMKGTAGQLRLNRLLEKFGMKESDLRVIDMNDDSAKAALSTGDVDAYITSSTDLVSRGLVRRIYKIDDPKVNAPSQIWVAEEFEAKYPQIVQRFVNALVRTAVWSSDEKNRDEQFRLWAKTGTPYSDYKEDFKGDTLRDRLSPLLDEYYVSSLAKSIAEAKKFRFTRRDVQQEGWVEPKYLQAALKEQKLEHFWDEFDADGNRKKK